MKQGLAHVAQVSLLPLLSSVYQIKYKDVIMFHIRRTWHLYVILYNCLFCRSCLLYLWQGFSGLKKKRRQLHELFILSLFKFLDRQILFASYNFNVYWGLSIFCYLWNLQIRFCILPVRLENNIGKTSNHSILQKSILWSSESIKSIIIGRDSQQS